MSYYIQVNADDQPTQSQIWKVTPKRAERIDVVPSQLTTHYAESGENALSVLRKRFPVSTFHPLSLIPGDYYPSMARPIRLGHDPSPGHNPDNSEKARNARATSTGQLHALIQQLEQICRVVHPKGSNLKTFGHEIRNVLLLACTEVELQWRTVLKANGVRGETTKDYVKLATPMKLAEYCVAFPYYPWLPDIRPFDHWHSCTSTPTQDLQWYAAYNAVKHDRGSNFAKASLEHAFQAVTGFFVMLCAEYGWDFALQGEAASRAFFQLTHAPQWHPSEIYVLSTPRKLRPIRYQF